MPARPLNPVPDGPAPELPQWTAICLIGGAGNIPTPHSVDELDALVTLAVDKGQRHIRCETFTTDPFGPEPEVRDTLVFIDCMSHTSLLVSKAEEGRRIPGSRVLLPAPDRGKLPHVRRG